MNIFRDINDLAERTAEKLAGLIVGDDYEEVITLQFCVDLVKRERRNNPKVTYFTLSVKSSESPANECDNFVVRLSLKDAKRNALMSDYVFHAGEVDADITELLDGKESVTVRI